MTEVLILREGRTGRIRLNRPRAIHALNQSMCSDMIAALLEWRDDPGIEAVMIDHAEGRGFCAGGDVVALRDSGIGDGQAARAFFHEEYRLNHLLFSYPKPRIAFMHGITMGGGVGISLPCSHRVATDQTRFAMPETAIGLFPDVGGGWYLSRLPRRTGQFLALTGARLDGAECRFLGLATHYLAEDRLDAVKRAISQDPARLDSLLEEAATPAPDARIERHVDQVERHFASDRLEEVLASLAAAEGEWAQKELKALRTKSPLSCKVSLRLLAQGATMPDFASEMRAEYALAARIVRQQDFAEGVRAVLVDKDNDPHWDPATPEAVTDEILDALFAPMPAGEEWTPIGAEDRKG